MSLTTKSFKQKPDLPFLYRQGIGTVARKYGREACEPRDERMQRWHYRLEKLFARQLY
jgi:hypothetical protein